MLALPLTGSTPELYHGKYAASLFANGEQGAWYEPSLSNGTLFQDAAGTTPVTAVEQPVGLMKDKSGRGNHAKQTTSADRPVFSARYNLLTKTEYFNVTWSKLNSPVITSNYGISPNGTNTSSNIVTTIGGAAITNTFSTIANTKYTGSLYFKKTVSTTAFPMVALNGNGVYCQVIINTNTGVASARAGVSNNFPTNIKVENAANDFWKLSFDFITNRASIDYFIYPTSSIDGVYYSPVTGSCEIWGASLVPANQAHLPYQRVNTATDYDADPVKFPPYLKFNGVNSWMVTPSIDFTATDKMTVFAGVRKLSSTLYQVLTELGTNIGTVNGSFMSHAPDTAGTYLYRSRGTVGPATASSAASYPEPITNVLAGASDIAGDAVALRINGAQVATSATDQGTGNYGNYPLYIGRRGGTSLPFNGQIHSLIIRGAATDDAHLTHTEKYIAYKTGITL